MVFKIGEGISCSSFSVKELDVIVHKKNFSLYNHIKFWPFCTPHHYLTWWLRWELGILTRPYCCSTSLANLNTMGKQITWIVWEMMQTWWHHQMEPFSMLLAIVQGIHWSPVNSLHKGQWCRALMFPLISSWIMNKQLSKQSWGWWFETPSCSLWHHCN